MAHAYVIDGYNVVFYRSRVMKGAPPHRLRKARESFLELLVKFRETSGDEVTVVFDGTAEPAGVLQDRSEHGKVVVIYSPRERTADQTITSIVEKRGARTPLTVVTNDRELGALARTRNAEVISAAEFLDRAADETGAPGGGRNQTAPARPDPHLRAKRDGISASEVDQWLEVFGMDEDDETPPERR